jgi:hypothetical protein
LAPGLRLGWSGRMARLAQTSSSRSPSGSQPARSQPSRGQSAGSRPARRQPARSQPSRGQSAGSRPARRQPAGSRPARRQPARSRPSRRQPARRQSPGRKSLRWAPMTIGSPRGTLGLSRRRSSRGVFRISDRQRGVDATEAYIRPFNIAMGVRHTRRCPHGSTVHPIVPRAIRCRLKYIGTSNLRP